MVIIHATVCEFLLQCWSLRKLPSVFGSGNFGEFPYRENTGEGVLWGLGLGVWRDLEIALGFPKPLVLLSGGDTG